MEAAKTEFIKEAVDKIMNSVRGGTGRGGAALQSPAAHPGAATERAPGSPLPRVRPDLHTPHTPPPAATPPPPTTAAPRPARTCW